MYSSKYNNASMLTDLYEFTMCSSYFDNNINETATFDLFIRKMPETRSYFIAMGIFDALKALSGMRFSNEQLKYLQSIGISKKFIMYLKHFKFTGDVRAVPDGTIVFQNEPIMSITAPIIQAQLVEGFILNNVNVQTTLASKAARVVYAAKGRDVIEFGMRRSQGISAAMQAAKCSYAVGAAGTSDVLAGMEYHIPVFGTMAHSYIMRFESEEAAFSAFVKTFPNGTTLLVDTYDTLYGIKKAIRVAKRLEEQGNRLGAIRLDSGDLLALSRIARSMLDKAGLGYVKIFASGDLDEYRISKLLGSGAPIDFFGVGTKMSTSSDAPYVDVVYKLSEIRRDKMIMPIMKLSKGKLTMPGSKQVFRRVKNGAYISDTIGLEGEKLQGKRMLIKMMEKGKITCKAWSLDKTRKHAMEELTRLPSKYKRIESAATYPVLLSKKLAHLSKALEQRLEKH